MTEFDDDGGPIVIKLTGSFETDYTALRSIRERTLGTDHSLVLRGHVDSTWLHETLTELNLKGAHEIHIVDETD